MLSSNLNQRFYRYMCPYLAKSRNLWNLTLLGRVAEVSGNLVPIFRVARTAHDVYEPHTNTMISKKYNEASEQQEASKELPLEESPECLAEIL